MKKRVACTRLAPAFLAAMLSALVGLHAQDAGQSPAQNATKAKGPTDAPGESTDATDDKPAKAGKSTGNVKPAPGGDSDRLQLGPAPRLKAPAPRGPDNLDLLPTDPESVVRNKILPLVPEAPDLDALQDGARELKGRVEDRVKKERNRTEEAADEVALRVRFRQAYTRALSDPEVQQHWQESRRAGTDYERREQLKSYYTRLYGLMRKSDRHLAGRVDREEKESMRRLTQNRVETTEPPLGE